MSDKTPEQKLRALARENALLRIELIDQLDAVDAMTAEIQTLLAKIAQLEGTENERNTAE